MTSTLSMIFEVGFNFCCRNFTNKNDSSENFSLKLSCNLLNEVTNLTENCVVEFSGEWARTLSFVEPKMDLQIVSSGLMNENDGKWSECVMVRNLTFPDPTDVRYIIEKVSVVETQTERPNRLIIFDSSCRVLECKLSKEVGALAFPNYWMFPKRSIVDKDAKAIRPLTTITPDVAVINVLVAFIANSPPGPYKFERGSVCYVRTHVHVCDLSFRNLRLSAIRTANDFDFKDVPTFHLHIQIDKNNIEVAALPFLTVGDVLEVATVKPVFAQKQAWNLLHKEKGFGETKIKIHKIETGKVIDVEGNKIVASGDVRVAELMHWMKERLKRDSLIGPNQQGKLINRQMWMNGRDIAVQCLRWNKHSSSLFVSDYSEMGNENNNEVEVRIRSTQSSFAATLNYLFAHLDTAKHSPQYLLLRNVRFNGSDDTLLCSVEYVTKLPAFCLDVQELLKRKNGIVTPNPIIEAVPLKYATHYTPGTPLENSGCVDASSQIFEYASDSSGDEEDESKRRRV